MKHLNVTLSFNRERDKDLIEWMDQVPHRELSATVRRIIRLHIQAGGTPDALGLIIGMLEVILFKLDGLQPGAGPRQTGELDDSVVGDLPQDIKENLGGLGK